MAKDIQTIGYPEILFHSPEAEAAPGQYDEALLVYQAFQDVYGQTPPCPHQIASVEVYAREAGLRQVEVRNLRLLAQTALKK
jgi:hypothetical protein